MRPALINGFVLSLVLCLVLAGCAGRTPQPVSENQAGDEQKECALIKNEVTDCQGRISALTQKSANTQGANVALAVTGAILFFPALFFMDLSDADKVELEALRKRHNVLVKICADKNCGYDFKEIPAPAPPAQGPDDMSGNKDEASASPAISTNN